MSNSSGIQNTRSLVRVEELWRGLIRAALVVAPAAQAQRQDEDMKLAGLAPVDLVLLALHLEVNLAALGRQAGAQGRPQEKVGGVRSCRGTPCPCNSWNRIYAE